MIENWYSIQNPFFCEVRVGVLVRLKQAILKKHPLGTCKELKTFKELTFYEVNN